MVHIGYWSLVLAALCAGYALILSVWGLTTRTGKWMVNIVRAMYAVMGFLTLAVLSLLILLVQHDFEVRYVASYTNRALPLVYVLSALWAGQEGSLLFWGWLLALCSSVFIWRNAAAAVPTPSPAKRGTIKGLPSALVERLVFCTALASVLGVFLILLLGLANPFEWLPSAPLDGNGLNPLLQNFYMAIHPPILFIGYAGFIVPFALSFAALSTGTLNTDWLKTARRWTLFAWYFLGIGIILGAHWAYLELGWGGYWVWDPVENASLIPWLTGTALVHTIVMQRRKGGVKVWTLGLCILTFALCIFATFVTRSGMINSVHAFGESSIGYYFLGFLLVVALTAIGLLIVRWNTLHTTLSVASVISKESSFLLMNQLLVGLGVAVLYGTLFPFFNELLTGRKIVVDAKFFNRITIPVGLVILVLIGICQRIPWKKTVVPSMTKQIGLPLGAAFGGMIVLFLLGVKHLLTLLTCWFGLFIVFTIVADVSAALRQRFGRKATDISSGTVLLNTLAAQKRLYASYIFHLGVVLVYLGIAVSSAYKLQQETTLKPGESITVGGLRFQYGQLQMTQDAQKVSVSANLTVYRQDKAVTTLRPQKQLFGEGEKAQMVTEIGLHSSLARDIYVILVGWQDDQSATFTIILHPLILWIWIGGFFLFTIGFIVAMLPSRQAQLHEEKEQQQMVAS
jgi:cytochrome c-type biogenesis protein CcmF